MNYHFFAMMSRMKYIERWSLMRNSVNENISEHSLEVAMITHALAVISNVRMGNSLNVEKAALIGMYHDCTEIITGDLPTPVKYHNTQLQEAFLQMEELAANRLLDLLPADMKGAYESVFFQAEEDEYLWKLKKAADKLSALVKCIEERKAGNSEFAKAEKALWQAVSDMHLREAEIFIELFLPSYSLTLDELS
ncbi:5'-deoxynucleotidase [Anaeromicropila populeti]|uniref:5'-deoxynucleotidase n=1 Tax=Anaeromicropila populeti TaxID=37658 RepID=A0A1I6IFQ2_9FIRM|nr:5'-deoxynucleotidase [Anaeromicropila populeti]SFR65150.1 5'-deoxynucleotidase [Anaeromicropila populeti]